MCDLLSIRLFDETGKLWTLVLCVPLTQNTWPKNLPDTHNNCSSVPSKRWKTIRNILHNSNKCLNNCLFNAQMFCDFFERKLADIQSSIVLNITSISRILVPPPASPVLFPGFSPVATSEASILIQSLTKSSPIDIIPFFLMKSCCPLFRFSLLS